MWHTYIWLFFFFFFKVWIITFLWLPLNDNDDLFVTGAHMPVFSEVSWGVILHYRASWIGIISLRPTPFNQVQLYSYWCASLLRHILNHWNGDLEKKQTNTQTKGSNKQNSRFKFNHLNHIKHKSSRTHQYKENDRHIKYKVYSIKTCIS